jgi:hypothetical protein
MNKAERIAVEPCGCHADKVTGIRTHHCRAHRQAHCDHQSFAAYVGVNRLEDKREFVADVRIRCQDCDLPFRFLGTPPGVSLRRPTVSVDGLELRVPIEPETRKRMATSLLVEPSPLPEGE